MSKINGGALDRGDLNQSGRVTVVILILYLHAVQLKSLAQIRCRALMDIRKSNLQEK